MTVARQQSGFDLDADITFPWERGAVLTCVYCGEPCLRTVKGTLQPLKVPVHEDCGAKMQRNSEYGRSGWNRA